MVVGTLLRGVGALTGGSLLNKNPSPFDFAQRRRIQDKSFIEFHFPSSPHRLVAKLPFYENINIRESKKANIVSYDPIGRNSSLYTYTGASSRKLKLSFALTLQHIQSMHDRAKIRFKPGDGVDKTREEIKKAMKRGNQASPESQIKIQKGQQTYLESIPNQDGEDSIALAHSEPTNWVLYVAWWVNLVRSSVLSNQTNSMEGPPIIRLTHGELYQNIPCICRSYDISYDKEAGLDVDSLLSRRILVNMELEEFRAGNFGKFDRESKQILDRDNVTGWESIIVHSSTDPGGYAVSGV